MPALIDLETYPVKQMLGRLLEDKSTKRNIVFATADYRVVNDAIREETQITPALLLRFGNNIIQPRVMKSMEEQTARTRSKAEVYTPAWVCNRMNNHCDVEWFGRDHIFNVEDETAHTWMPTENKVSFPTGKTWQQYVDSRRLEITCGEAPYIVSRYDAASGEQILLHQRIGILDRKLRVVNENTDTEDEWLAWVLRAFQSVYAYEYQGDSLLIARINLLLTFTEYLKDRWQRDAGEAELRKITNVIAWNIWQMDGITGTPPFGKPKESFRQLSFFDFTQGHNDTEKETPDCRIYDWRAGRSVTYRSIREGEGR